MIKEIILMAIFGTFLWLSLCKFLKKKFNLEEYQVAGIVTFFIFPYMVIKYFEIEKFPNLLGALFLFFVMFSAGKIIFGD